MRTEAVASTESLSRDVCWVCANEEYQLVCIKQGYRYVSCSECGVVRQHPYPTDQEIARYYGSYQSKKASDSVYLTDTGFAGFKHDKELTFADLGLDDDAFSGKRICDVGCATGQFVQMMMERRPAYVMGLDASPECVAIAQARGLHVMQGDFLELEETFDVINMSHLIEHVPRPTRFFKQAFRLLAPGGWFLIETPVIGAVSQAFGEHWRYFMPVEHINLFPQNALFRACVEAGFAVKKWIRFGSGNDSGTVPAPNKRAMDIIAKRHGYGDTLAALFVK